MKTVHSRMQGCWLHPALYEIGKALGHCRYMRGDMLGPCRRREYLKSREEWCENCIASEALGELASILGHLNDNNTCPCEGCWKIRDFLRNGAENDRKFGIRGL